MKYRAIYRRGEVAIPRLFAVAAAIIGSVWFAMGRLAGNAGVSAVLWILGLSVLAIALLFAGAFRVHRWTTTDRGIRIAESPKVPLTGLRRNAELRWGEIAAIRRVEAGLDRQIELVARDGRRFRMSQAMKAGVGDDPAAPLEQFLDHIVQAAHQAGADLGDAVEGLSFWNRLPGIALLLVFFAIALTFAGAAVLMLLDGEVVGGRRSGEGSALALALPFGTGWLLWKSLRRRRAVLKQGFEREV